MVSPLPIHISAVTGNIRHVIRRRLFRQPLIVLQVEEQVMSHSPIIGKRTSSRWRDATVDDMSVVLPNPGGKNVEDHRHTG